jgi:SAM-dependent methyltransferase
VGALIEKWNRVYSGLNQESRPVAAVLAENDFLLPPTGAALDLACGLGGNAVFLAEHGLAVTAWDISSVAIDGLAAYALLRGLTIDACQREITANSFKECRFDVIVVSRFLDRGLRDAIIDALKPDGLLFYQTFTREKASPEGPDNPEYLLGCSELPALFSPLRLVFYRDNGLIGEQQRGLRNEAQFIGRKCK